MAQKRFNEYQSTLISDDNNKEKIGQLPPGRYAGFDTITYAGSGSTFGLSHVLTGIDFTKSNATAQDDTGVVIAQSGVVIQESSSITGLTLGTNVGNATRRIDLIVMTHSYILSPGGSTATYSVIQGTFGTYTAPNLPSPTTQVIIGEIHCAPGATAAQILASCLTPVAPNYPATNAFDSGWYYPKKSPGVGNNSTALLNLLNKFTQRLDTPNLTLVKYETVNTNHVKWNIPWDSNTIKHDDTGGSTLVIDYAELPTQGNSGTRLLFKVDEGSTDSIYFNIGYAGSVPAGHCKIKAPVDYQKTYNLGGFGIVTGVFLFAGDTAVLELINNTWVITSVTFIHSSSNVAKGKIMGEFTHVTVALTANTGDVSATMFAIYNPHNLAISSGEVVLPRAGWYKFTVRHHLQGSPSPGVTNRKFGLNSSNMTGISFPYWYIVIATPTGTGDSNIVYSNTYIRQCSVGDKITGAYNLTSGGSMGAVVATFLTIEEL